MEWTCIYITLSQSTDHLKRFTIFATFTHGRGKVPTAHQEQLGVQHLAQRHAAHLSQGDSNRLPSDHNTAGSTPELQPPLHENQENYKTRQIKNASRTDNKVAAEQLKQSAAEKLRSNKMKSYKIKIQTYKWGGHRRHQRTSRRDGQRLTEREREREGRTKTTYTEKLTRGLETGEVREEGKEDR